MALVYISIFFFGAAWASFLNATMYRVDMKYKYPEIFTKNSHCESCGKQLNWIELFPILGYIFLSGKCSKCKKNISIYYPLSELFLGIAFLLAYIYSFPIQILFLIIFLFILSYFDAVYMAISRTLVHIFLAFCILLFLLNINFANIVAPLTVAIVFTVINLFKKSFGFGDILILFGLGLILSYQQFIVMFWIGILIALLYSIVMLVVKKKNIKGAKIPMIPFFSIAFVIAIPFGRTLWEMLLNFVGI